MRKKTTMMSITLVVMVSKVAIKNTHRMTSCACHLGSGNGKNEKKNHNDECGTRRHGFRFYNTRKKSKMMSSSSWFWMLQHKKKS